MRYLIGIATSAVVFLYGTAGGQQLQDGITYRPDVVIVKVVQESIPLSSTIENGIALTGIAEIDNLNRQFSVSEVRELFPKSYELGESDLACYYRFAFESSAGLQEVLSDYDGLATVQTAEPVAIHEVDFYPNDPYRSYQWALARIDAYQAWDVTHGSSTVPLAILDTGVDWDHPDLNNDIWLNTADPLGNGDEDGNGYVDDYRGWDFVSYQSGCWGGEDCSGEDNNPMDFAGHGTHCSGIAAAETNNGIGVAGVGYNCTIMCLRIGWLASNGIAYVGMDYAAEALYYAGNKGAKAANCSWGSSYSSYLSGAVSFANNHGVVVVSAAGNDGNQTPPYLASRNDVIAVAATDQADHKASWSNYGTWVDVAAPGVSIYSTFFNNTYTYLDGTSMSAPHVVGEAGLICAADPSLTKTQVFNLIISSAEPINDYYYNQGLLGSGRINLNNAVMGLGVPEPPEPLSPPNNSFSTETRPTFTWTSVPGATVYNIQVAEDDAFISIHFENANLTQTSYTSPDDLPDGIYYWHVRAGDGSNWSDWSVAWSVGVDTQAPGSPTGFAIDPSGWSGDPTFTLNWTDPNDLSGIALHLYKVDSPPESDFDYDASLPPPPAEYVESENGSHTIYLWCMDNVGNVDYQTNVSATLYYDSEPPYGCVATSPSYSPSESFDVSWSSGSDDESGLSGLYDVRSKEDDGPWTDWLIGFEGLTSVFTGVDGHTYYFEARTSDNVGNEEPFTGEAETSTHITQSGGPCGVYVVGDFNGSEIFNVADIVDAFSKLKTGSPEAALLCECPEGSGNIWAVAMDVNNTCAFNVADIIDGISNLKIGSPELTPCELCPPGAPSPPGGDVPLRIGKSVAGSDQN